MSTKKAVQQNASKKPNVTRAIEVDLNALIDEKKIQPSPRPKIVKNSAVSSNHETLKKSTAAKIAATKSTPIVEKLAPIFCKSAPTTSISAKSETSAKKTGRKPKIVVVEKLKETPKNRPGRKPKREILDEDEKESTTSLVVQDPSDEKYPKNMTGELALKHFKSFQDKLDEWRSLDSRIHFRILKKTFEKLTKSKESRVQCLNTSCSSTYTTAYGMQYHLRVCGIPIENRLKQCSHCEKKIPSEELASHIQMEHDIQTSSSVRKSASKCRNLIGQIGQVEKSVADDKKKKRKDDSEDENYADENEDENDLQENQANSSAVSNTFKSPSKKKRFKKVRAIPETLRKIWHQKLEKAFEGFIRTNFISTRETWIPDVNFQSFRLRRDSTFFEKFEQESMEFCFKKLSKPQKLKLFESSDIDKKKSVGYCGGPTICAKWCPLKSQLPDEPQYLAVCNHIDHSMQNYSGSMENYFQIWSYDSKNLENEKRLKCEYLVRHEYGLSLHLKWCPSGANIPESGGQESILGLLAVSTGMGHILLYSLPYPKILKNRPPSTLDGQNLPPIYDLQPDFVLDPSQNTAQQVENRLVYSFDWSMFEKHNRLAAGYVDGSLSVWDLNNSNSPENETRKPNLTLKISDTPLRNVHFVTKSKVLVFEMNRMCSLWDLDEYQCVYDAEMLCGLWVQSTGPLATGFFALSDSTIKLPTYPTYNDFCHNVITVLNKTHEDITWDMSISPWHGTILSVDNGGSACLTALEFYGPDINVNKRYPDLIGLATSVVEKDVKNGLESKKLIDYQRTVNDCRLEFHFCKEDKNRMANEKKFIENQINPVYPVAALFAADWNPNRNFAKLFCVAGEHGLLFVNAMEV